MPMKITFSSFEEKHLKIIPFVQMALMLANIYFMLTMSQPLTIFFLILTSNLLGTVHTVLGMRKRTVRATHLGNSRT